MKKIFHSFENFNNTAISIGSTIATILALSFTLSIIPLQKAADTWSPAIILIYKKDKKISSAIFIISIFVILAFLFSLFNSSYTLLCCFILIGITLDILRFYYAYVANLLSPKQMIDSLSKVIIKSFDKHVKNLDKCASFQYKMFSLEEKERFSITTIKANLLSQNDGFYKFFYQGIDEITEIIYKAIMRGEKILTKEALFALLNVITTYINFKKDIWRQIPPSPETQLTQKDIMIRSIDYINNSLYRLNQKAMEVNEESLVIEILRTYAKIVKAITELDINSEEYGDLLLSNYTVSYLRLAINRAKEKNMSEVILQSSVALAREAMNFSPKISSAIYIKIFDFLNDSIAFLFTKEMCLANHLLEFEQKIINQLVSQNHPQFSQIHSHLSESLQNIKQSHFV